jgi:hypothetical protein
VLIRVFLVGMLLLLVWVYNVPSFSSNFVFSKKRSTAIINSVGNFQNAAKSYCLHSLHSLISRFSLL